jgi:hypothetical protein
MLGQWFEEYDDLALDVQESNYRTFPLNVQRWLNFIDDHPLIAPRIAAWEVEADFRNWFAAIPVQSATVGGNRLDWPIETRSRLALQLGLFRAFGSGELDVAPFALQFFYVQGNFDAQVSNIARRIFTPFARELRREIQKLPLSELTESVDTSVPASDRVVLLDHNSASYKELVDALGKLERAVRDLNDYPDPKLKEQHIAEICAGQELLKPRYTRIAAVWGVLRAPLQFLMKQFAKIEVGHIANLVWKILVKLFGS